MNLLTYVPYTSTGGQLSADLLRHQRERKWKRSTERSRHNRWVMRKNVTWVEPQWKWRICQFPLRLTYMTTHLLN